MILKDLPTGKESSTYDVKIGDEFTVEYLDGSCLCVTNGDHSFIGLIISY